MWRRMALLLILPVAALAVSTANAQADTGVNAELCSAPAVVGTFALRACIERLPDGALQAYAYVSLQAGHSPCTVRIRYVDGATDPLSPPVSCPSGAITHWRVDHVLQFVCCGTVRTAASIQRDDGSIGVKAVSPPLSV